MAAGISWSAHSMAARCVCTGTASRSAPGRHFPGPSGMRTSSTDLYIGYYPAPHGCLAGGFTGSIDEPAVWNFALDAVQVGQLEPAGGSTAPGARPSTPASSSTTTGGNATGTGNRTHHGPPAAVSLLRISPSTLAITENQHRKGERGRGMTISYTATQAGSTYFSVLQPQAGVKQRGRCVGPPRGRPAQHAQRCTRYRVRGRFAHADRAGANHFAFTAVTILQLRPHRYVLDATPQAHGLNGKTVSVPFTIKR
jgi:hypothetical protein